MPLFEVSGTPPRRECDASQSLMEPETDAVDSKKTGRRMWLRGGFFGKRNACMAVQMMIPPSCVAVLWIYMMAICDIRRDVPNVVFVILSLLPLAYLLYYLGYLVYKNLCYQQPSPMVSLTSITIAEMVHMVVLLTHGGSTVDWVLWAVLMTACTAALIYVAVTTIRQRRTKRQELGLEWEYECPSFHGDDMAQIL
jgi:hypothetical protein